MAQHSEQPARIAGMQSDGRLVERIKRGGQQAAERAREMDALGLAARERTRLPLQRQVAEPDFVEIADPIVQLAQHDACARRRCALVSAADCSSHCGSSRTAIRPTSAIDIAFDPHVERLGFELGAAA